LQERRIRAGHPAKHAEEQLATVAGKIQANNQPH
jgi:hypothetical protein